MLLRRSGRRPDAERYRQLAIRVGQADVAGRWAEEQLRDVVRAGAALSGVRAAYRAIGVAAQEPLPAQPALDRQRPPELTRQLSTLRTRRQWYLMAAPPGVLAPAAVRPNSRAARGPHVAGLEADFAERPWGIDLVGVLDRRR